MSPRPLYTTILALVLLLYTSACEDYEPPPRPEGSQIATFAGGCFWCMEPPFDATNGVQFTTVGYTGGDEPDPSYKEVAYGRTGHREAIEVTFDPNLVSYEQLLTVFWRNINPCQANGQFVDTGPQYASAIYTHDETQHRQALASRKKLANSGRFKLPIVTPVLPAKKFWPAERYHQDFYKDSSRRYKAYRRKSGRDDFLRKTWGDAPHAIKDKP